MDKEQAINLMKQLQGVVKATPQEHEIIRDAILFLSTLQLPQEVITSGTGDQPK